MSSNPLGLSFGRAALDYERGRPEWPREVVDIAGLDARGTLLDLAAGTGKLTRLLAHRFARVIAVEPDDADARAARRARSPSGGARRQRGGDPAR